ncbi:type IV pilin [Methanoregula sp.]|uniref:type IV pilin n=1 Tax=Methanoregula sp. TaxID=2052170 RepID=UPI002373C96A|nr:type IV pilin [Methanoregula sp.]MDD1686443.1 type IV pilin [Methanoregula sp.]
MTRKYTERAVSPVVGVMLMLVVVIIIAAVVSAFAGSAVGSQKKVPQATIQGKFSVATGMEITHAGGNALATNDLVFTVRNSPVFGPNLEQTTAQILNKSTIQDRTGLWLDNGDGSTNVTSFKSGDTLFINSTYIRCDWLQPVIVPTNYESAISSKDEFTYTGGETQRWGLCFKNNDNIGKTFYFDISDKNGNLISRSEVTIAS